MLSQSAHNSPVLHLPWPIRTSSDTTHYYKGPEKILRMHHTFRSLPAFVLQTSVDNGVDIREVLFGTGQLHIFPSFARLAIQGLSGLLLVPLEPTLPHPISVEAVHIAHVLPSSDAHVIAVVPARPPQRKTSDAFPHIADRTSRADGTGCRASQRASWALRSSRGKPILRLRTRATGNGVGLTRLLARHDCRGLRV